MNHSIGPWSHKHDIGVYDRNGRLLVEPSCRIGYDEAIANARLIAAAPELLEALRLASAVLRIKGFVVAAAMADVAIAKATNA